MLVNPLRPAGKLKPFVDTAPPVIHEVRFHTPAEPAWGRRVRSFAAAAARPAADSTARASPASSTSARA